MIRWSLLVAMLAAGGTAEGAELSAGCGAVPPPAPPSSLELRGERREILVALPADYRADRPHRLVVAFHGRTNPAERVRRYFGLEGVDDGRSIFVYPRALQQADGTFIWRMPADFALFDAILENLSARYCIATDQLYAVGHSLGATFANSLACARAHVLRGVASVAGGIGWSDCSGRIAALLLHNPDDRLVPVEQGRAALETLRGGRGGPATRLDEPFACQRFGGGPNPVLWCLYEDSGGRDYPHQWPPGAERAAMEFFASLE